MGLESWSQQGIEIEAAVPLVGKPKSSTQRRKQVTDREGPEEFLGFYLGPSALTPSGRD
jgi:hypothetical protein